MKIIKEAYSGAQSSGKSTRINAVKRIQEVANLPIIILPEYATIVAGMGYELNKKSGAESQFKMTEMQIIDEVNAINNLKRKYPDSPVGVIICDRPIYDSYVYGRLGYEQGRMTGQELNQLYEMVKNHVRKYPYDKVYFCQPRDYYEDSTRKLGMGGHTFKEAVAWQKTVHRAFVKFYKENKFMINIERIKK